VLGNAGAIRLRARLFSSKKLKSKGNVSKKALSDENITDRKYVFICGLQRSGTSVLARNIGKLESCTSFKNTGVLQDEGQYLQDVYRPDGAYGGTGRYGFDPRAHLTEKSRLLTPENVARLHRSWRSYWDPAKSICVEKTPGNLIMTRFLQAAFPNSYFIVIRRHPVPVSMATQRWKVSLTPLHRLFEHWLRCYDLFEEDKMHLKRVYELSYEEYIKEPDKYHREIALFIGTRTPPASLEEVTDVHNKRYFDRWSNLLTNSSFKSYYRYIASKYEPRLARYNYSLLSSPGTGRSEEREASDTPAVVGALYCLGADANALAWRITLQSKWLIKRTLRAHLPEPVKAGIKRLLGRPSLEKQTANVS